MHEGDLVWSRWEEVDRIFAMVLDHPESERSDAVTRACGDDHALRDAILDLLERTRAEGRLAASPGPDLLRVALPSADPVRPAIGPGDLVGRYRIVGELGRGGMATVYEAERDDGTYRQAVALKVLRRGLDTDRIVDRFLAERQILSDFAHPNIARLLDGGATDDGRPFLVVEKVDGDPLTRWADARGLGLRGRLGLFLQVTDAVAEAHRRLVVHRDLKPSNILVDRSGRAKLLDFGIAKLLDPTGDCTELTQLGAYPLTRRYASPEQLRGDRVTTSSDIYQLGLVLYELLTGAPPFADEDGSERGLVRGRPVPPSRSVPSGAFGSGEGSATGRSPDALPSKELRGDLDTIVGKALEAEPEERYRSVEDLAEDIRRHLERLPIRARPAPWSLRLRKWVGRNRWAPPVAAVLTLTAAGYVGTLTVTAQRLERERNAARAQAERAEEIQAFMTGLFRSADPYSPADPERGREITVAEALDIGAERVRADLADRPAHQAVLLGAISDVYGSLDLTEPASRLREEALDLETRVYGRRSAEVAEGLRKLAVLVSGSGHRDSAEVLLRSSLALTGELHGTGDIAYARTLADLGELEGARGNYEEATSHLEEAVAILEAAADRADPEVLASSHAGLALVYPHLNREREAVTSAAKALEFTRSALGDAHPRTALAQVGLANTHDHIGEPEQAASYYRAALPVLERTLGRDHHETLQALNNLAVSLFGAGALDEAEAVLRRVVDLRIAKHGEVHQEVATALQNLAATLNARGKLDEAEGALNRAHDVYLRVLEPGHHVTAYPLLTLSAIRLDRGDFAGAEVSARQATGILREALPAGHFATAVAECRWGRALAGQGRVGAATPLLETAARSLASDARAGLYAEECLAAAVDHLRRVDAAPERWALLSDRLEELSREGVPAG